MTPPNPNHQRLFSRIGFDSPVQLTIDGQTLSARLLDIALKGALLEVRLKTPPTLSHSCELLWDLGDGETQVHMQGYIAHIRGNGPLYQIGMGSHEIDIASLTALRRIMELNVGDSELIHREVIQLIHAR